MNFPVSRGSAGRIKAIREIEGKVTSETRFFALSWMPAPEVLLSTVRDPWAIENALHWPLRSPRRLRLHPEELLRNGRRGFLRRFLAASRVDQQDLADRYARRFPSQRRPAPARARGACAQGRHIYAAAGSPAFQLKKKTAVIYDSGLLKRPDQVWTQAGPVGRAVEVGAVSCQAKRNSRLPHVAYDADLSVDHQIKRRPETTKLSDVEVAVGLFEEQVEQRVMHPPGEPVMIEFEGNPVHQICLAQLGDAVCKCPIIPRAFEAKPASEEKRAKVGDALRGGISWRCRVAVNSLLRKGYATCQRLPSPNCPIHRVFHPTHSRTFYAMARASLSN